MPIPLIFPPMLAPGKETEARKQSRWTTLSSSVIILQCWGKEQFHWEIRSVQSWECGGEVFLEKDGQGDWDAGQAGFGKRGQHRTDPEEQMLVGREQCFVETRFMSS